MNGLRVIGGTAGAVILASAPAILYFEDVIPHTHADPVGIPTACAGETGPHIKMGQVFTMDECMQMLNASQWRHWNGLQNCTDAEVTFGEANALLSWTYNVGVGAACSSTLVRLLNSGADGSVWCHQLPRWVYAKKLGVTIRLPGLVKRRRSELHMCLTGEWDFDHA